jgi:hypothetical protein
LGAADREQWLSGVWLDDRSEGESLGAFHVLESWKPELDSGGCLQLIRCEERCAIVQSLHFDAQAVVAIPLLSRPGSGHGKDDHGEHKPDP